MTTDVKINIKPENVLPDLFDWIHDQGWKHIVEWRWFRPEYNESNTDKRYTFQFENENHAIIFALRWL